MINKKHYLNNDELTEQVESFLLDNYSITNEKYNRLKYDNETILLFQSMILTLKHCIVKF